MEHRQLGHSGLRVPVLSFDLRNFWRQGGLLQSLGKQHAY